MCWFVHNHCLGYWPDTPDAIGDLCPYFFALGHTNYTRWVPAFLRDMAQLPDHHPDVHANFMEGPFVVQQNEKFSLMGLDQSQEHSIRMLKEDSGPKGLYGQTEEKLIIELSKAEVLHIIEEFECASTHVIKTVNTEHPESAAFEQQTLLKQLDSFLGLVNRGIIINPYEEAKHQLRTLNTGEYVDPEVSKCLNELPSIGKAMYSEYVKVRIQDCIVPLSNVIPKGGCCNNIGWCDWVQKLFYYQVDMFQHGKIIDALRSTQKDFFFLLLIKFGSSMITEFLLLVFLCFDKNLQ